MVYFEDKADFVEVHFADGSSTQADLLIGADGTHSMTHLCVRSAGTTSLCRLCELEWSG